MGLLWDVFTSPPPLGAMRGCPTMRSELHFATDTPSACGGVIHLGLDLDTHIPVPFVHVQT